MFLYFRISKYLNKLLFYCLFIEMSTENDMVYVELKFRKKV